MLLLFSQDSDNKEDGCGNTNKEEKPGSDDGKTTPVEEDSGISSPPNMPSAGAAPEQHPLQQATAPSVEEETAHPKLPSNIGPIKSAKKRTTQNSQGGPLWKPYENEKPAKKKKKAKNN